MNTHSGLSRTLSVLLTLAMMIGLLSVGAVGAFAEGEEPAAEKPYVVLSNCDSEAGWSISGNEKKGLDTADKKQGAASLVAAGGGEGNNKYVNFMATNAFNTPIPADWDHVYMEFWLYINDIAKLDSFVIEISQDVDKIESQWAKKNGQLPMLQSGWNKLLLDMGSSAELTEKGFETVKGIRIFETNAAEGLILKIDDVCLSKGTAADDTTALDAQIAAADAYTDEDLADFDTENVDSFKEARDAAKAVKAQLETENKPTQRDVDAAAAYLETVIAKLSYDPGVTEKTLLLHGRTYYQNKALMLYWTNSGFTFNFTGTGATAHMTSSNISENLRGYLNVYVDGALTPTHTICLDQAEGDYVLAEGLAEGDHTIEVRKRNEANYGGSATIGVSEVAITDGVFRDPPAAAERRIEVIGDSITSGFGNLITDGQGNYTSTTVEGTMTYAALTGKAFGAETNILSRSGIRFVYSNENLDKVDSWYQHYANTATLPNDNRCADTWDFASYPNDVVVINLGTNDNGAKYKDGSSISNEDVTKDAAAFLQLIREKNPDALIVWAYGIMGSGRADAIQAAIQQLNEAGDENLYFFAMNRIQPATEETGLGNHPTVATNINRSFDLTAFIAEKTGWEYSFDAQVATQLAMVAGYTDEVLADYTETSAKALKDAVAAAKALTNESSDEDIIAAVKAIQVAKIGLELADVDYSYAKTDISTGEAVDFNGSVVGKSDSVEIVEAPGDTHAYKLPNQNHGIGVKIDPKVVAGDNKNVTILVEYYMDNASTQDNTRLGLLYKNAEGANSKVMLRKVAAEGFTGAEADKWALWEVKLTDAAIGEQTVDWSADFTIVKWGAQDDKTNGVDFVYIRSVTVMSTPDTKSLEDKVKEAEALDETDYVDFTDVKTALDEAKKVLADKTSTQKKIDAALAALTDAMEALEEIPVEIDRAALEALVADTDGLDEMLFTAESFAAVKTALDEAKKVLDNKDATPEQIETAYKALTDALEKLEFVFPLFGDINGDRKVDTTDARLALQYAVGKITLTDTQLLFGDVDGSGKIDTTDARLILQYAVGKISSFPVNTVEPEDLQAYIEEAEKLVPEAEEKYTEESVAVLKKAIADAKTVLENKEATNDDRLGAVIDITLSLMLLEEKTPVTTPAE